jgi:PAS domain S-box-containing protein
MLLNGMTEKLFGHAREELLGQPVEVLIPEDLRARHVHHRNAYCAHPITRPMGSGLALQGRRKNGSCFPIEISLSQIGSSEEFGVTAIIRDTSERKKAEDDLRASQEKYNRELQSKNQEIERADRLKSEFLGSMSHELRTPLHTIIGFSDLLAEGLKGPLNDDQKRFVGHIQRDSMHLLELINQILDLSKIESGLLELRSDTFEMSGAVEEVLSSVRLLGEAKLIRIETELGARVTLTADRLRFKQILLNLLSNAVKFSPEGEKVRIGATCRDGFAEVAVSDNGIGVPESEHDSIFNKFYQVAVTTKNVREGTGLGLAITKALVEQHGGRIWLESEPGKGSCFRFTIPAQAGPEEGDAA